MESTIRADAQIGRILEEIGERLDRLGLNLMLWDAHGAADAPLRPCCELCRTLHDAGHPCEAEAAAVAEQVVRSKQRADTALRSGCRVMGVPVRRRRRVIGAATACYPPLELMEEESLARLCDRLKLDRRAVESIARDDCRRTGRDAPELASALEWMIGREQSHATADRELENLSVNLATTYEELSLLYRISGSMRVTQEPADFLHTVCEELLEVAHIEAAAAVEYAHPAGNERDTLVIAGEIDLAVDQLQKLMGEAIAGRFGEAGHPVLCNDCGAPGRPGAQRVRNYIAAPLMSDNERIGMLVGFNKVADDFDSVDMKLIQSISSQASIFLANNRLYADLQDLLMGVLHALTATIDAKDPYTCGHSQRVALLSRRIAEEMGFDDRKVEQIYLSGLLHDIGKIGVPEAVLTKPGKLDDDEFGKIRLHPSVGARILGGIRQLDTVIVGMLTHHERLDGKGYPRGLKGEDFPMEGRIIGLADSFDAMTSDRTYRKALPLETVVEEIRRNAGTQFDPKVVAAFLRLDLEKLLADTRRAAETVFPLTLKEEQKP